MTSLKLKTRAGESSTDIKFNPTGGSVFDVDSGSFFKAGLHTSSVCATLALWCSRSSWLMIRAACPGDATTSQIGKVAKQSSTLRPPSNHSQRLSPAIKSDWARIDYGSGPLLSLPAELISFMRSASTVKRPRSIYIGWNKTGGFPTTGPKGLKPRCL